MYFERIINIQDNSETIRNFTKKEIEEIEIAKKEAESLTKEFENRAKNRESALAKLAALGLTEDEIAAL